MSIHRTPYHSVEPCQDALVAPRGGSIISSFTGTAIDLQSGSVSSPSHLCLCNEIRPVVELGTTFLEGREKTTDISVTPVTQAYRSL
jgi:hypothetical protein